MGNLEPVAVIHSDPDIQGGVPVFVGTRVPFHNLIDHISAGDSLEVFLEAFPSVSRDQVVSALHLAEQALVERARSAG